MLTENEKIELMQTCYSIQRMERGFAAFLDCLILFADEETEERMKQMFQAVRKELL